MSEQNIYSILRNGGLSPVGACAMMGNLFCESALRSNNVQDNSPMGDHDYTYAVDQGIMTRWQFMSDSYGYGLAQWTLSTRKDNLYMFAKERGVSIGDESMQCDFCLYELSQLDEYKNLYQFLCTTDDLARAAERICAEYERPAVNNFSARINKAKEYFNQFADTGCVKDDSCPIEYEEVKVETTNVTVRVLKRGCLGRDVYLLQCGLFDMGFDCGMPDGDFGVNTEGAVKELQKANEMVQSGIADWFVWQTILNAR